MIIGLFQVLAFIPGASRAGVTITGARFLNVKRDSAAIFAMLLSVPVILASLCLGLFDMLSINLQPIDLIQPFIASVVSFLTAILGAAFFTAGFSLTTTGFATASFLALAPEALMFSINNSVNA